MVFFGAKGLDLIDICIRMSQNVAHETLPYWGFP